ncbi:hypothetical protein LTR49_018009 [Elasticomyces elasticus]|nr:hypothetical protein LTR49_018009 [Elasticomyces elasticus]
MATEDFQLYFEPDPTENTLLAGPEPGIEINREVISDATVAKCHFSVRTLVVKYGLYKSESACLLGFEFVFHPYMTRFKRAKIDIEFGAPAAGGNKPKTVLLYPHEVKGQVTEETIRRALSGEVTIGCEPYASITGNISHEREGKKQYYMKLTGSRLGSDGVRWTLEENQDQKDGIPTRFVGFIVVSSSGPFEANFDVEATIGRYQQSMATAQVMMDYVRRLVLRQQTDKKIVTFDSTTTVDRREDLTKSSFKIAGWTPHPELAP